MKTKIVGILVIMLLMATALPAVGTMNKIEEKTNSVLLGGVEWSKTYGGDESDRFVFVDQADDGGYFAGGSTEESNTQHPWLIKTDSDGNEEWSWEIIEVSNCRW